MGKVGKDGSFVNDLRLIYRVPETMGQITEGKVREFNLSLEMKSGRQRHRWSEERVLRLGLTLIRLRR